MRGKVAKAIRRYLASPVFDTVPDKVPDGKFAPKTYQYDERLGMYSNPGTPFRYIKECKRSMAKQLKKAVNNKYSQTAYYA